MIERDYILRMINQLVAVMARVLFHKRAYEYPDARRELQSAFKSLLGLRPDFVRQFSVQQLSDMLGKDEETVIAKSYVLGSLLNEESDIARLDGDESESAWLGNRALALLLSAFVKAGNEIEPGHAAKIDGLVTQYFKQIDSLTVLHDLFSYNELVGRFAKAEDVLFEMIELDPRQVEKGFAFYDRLLKRPAEDLIAGGLPRAEVIDGIQKLRDIQS